MFTIIENEQTPALSSMDDAEVFIKANKENLNNFLKFAKNHGRAAGLASNQVGLKDRFIAVKSIDGWILAIDPKIVVAIGDKRNCIEGCLSWPGQDIVASRHEKVIVSYYDLSGKEKRRHVHDSFESQVWQHEINHLNGVEELIVSKKEPVKKDIKIGRNDPCICGSGKKYKKCCL